MIRTFFEVQNRTEGITYLPLFEKIEDTNWNCSRLNDEHLKLNRNVVSIEDIRIFDVAQKSKTHDNSYEIKIINDFLKDQVYCVIGLMIRKVRSKSEVFYFIMLPNAQNTPKLFLIKKHRETSGTIDNHTKIGLFLSSLDNNTSNSEKSHDYVCDVILPGLLGENLFPFRLYVPRENHISIIGNSAMKSYELKKNEYNNLTGHNSITKYSARQIQRKRRDLNDLESERKHNFKPLSGSVQLTEPVFQRFVASDDYEAYLNNRNHFGIKSLDSGGRIAIQPLLVPLNTELTTPISLSEMHIVTTMKDVFKIKHNFSTLSAAINQFKRRCDDDGIIGENFDNILAAVASKLLEDISWQMVAEKPIPHSFKTIKVDVDQVSLLVSKFNIHNFMNEMDEFLLKMYHSMLDEVLLTKDSTYCLLRISYSLFIFKQSTARGGHTYMNSNSRKQFISLISEGQIGDVFNISVSLNNKKSRSENLEIVWNAIVHVTVFLETLGPHSTYQQSLCVKRLYNKHDNYEHHLISGPILPLLVCLYLGSTTDGINIAIETYNNKLRVFYDFQPDSGVDINDEMAKLIGDHLLNDWHFKIPCIIERFSKWLCYNSLKLGGLCIPPENCKLIWGIGCTVSTNETKHTNTSEHQPLSIPLSTPGADILNNFSKLPSKSHCTQSQLPSYTVVNCGLPPFVSEKERPFMWFEGAPIKYDNVDLVVVDESDGVENSDCNSDSDESLDFENEEDIVNAPIDNENTTQLKKIKLFPNIAIKCKTHVTYPSHGGILPFELQPTTIYFDKLTDSPDLLQNAIRSQCYNLSSRYAVGEYNVPMKSSAEIGCVFLDIFKQNDFAIFNVPACMNRVDKFWCNNEATLSDIEHNGSSARIEIAFLSPSVDENHSTLVRGIKDTLNTCLRNTKAYSVAPLTTVARFCLSGLLAKLSILDKMLSKDILSVATHDELVCTRLEIAAILRSYHSGQGKMRTKYVPLPKLAYMACRPVVNRMMTLMEHCRQTTLSLPLSNMYEIFLEGLFDVDGNAHSRIEIPVFVRKFEDTFVQKYMCGKYCDKCFKSFSSQQTIDAFASHSCTSLDKGRMRNINDNYFQKHLQGLESKLTSTQKTLMNLIHNGKNVFLDGYAGTGKSFTLTVAILQYLIKYGMNTFAVISPTKVAAALVGGVTFHSFLQIDSTSASQDIEEEQHKSLRPKEIVIQEAINRANGLVNENNHRFLFLKFGLRILFIDEVSMLSHDQIIYLDYFFRTLRQSNTPFGGLQIILCGDPLQLPPMVDQPKNGWSCGAQLSRHPVYFFESVSFLSGNFVVLYLSEIHRQSNSLHTTVLNLMRDGFHGVDVEEKLKVCDHINTQWGGKVSKTCAQRVLIALHEQFDEEIQELRKLDVALGLTNNSWEQKGFFIVTMLLQIIICSLIGKLHRLLWRMKEFWNDKLLLSYYEYAFDPVTFLKRPDVDFTKSTQYADYLDHLNRLVDDAEDLDLFNPVFNTENREVHVINKHFAIWRGESVILFESNDSVDCSDTTWNDDMDKFITKKTKLEKSLQLAVGQTVSFTSNGTSPHAANNSRGKLIGIECVDGVIDHIIVSPILSKSNLIPHPIKVMRLSNTVKYYDSKRKRTINLTRSQFPLRSADGATINTVQGANMIEAHIVNSQRNSKSGFGRMYVAFSRAVDESLVFPMFKIRPEDIVACPVALAFDLYHRPINNKGSHVTSVQYSLLINRSGTKCQIIPNK